MAASKLNIEQQEQLLEWLAADYTSNLIRAWFKERKWPDITKQTISDYRERNAIDLQTRRAARHAAALDSGLALKAERVQRLKEHADALEAIKWEADQKTGRLWNEKAWRETLDDLAREMGHRRQGIDLTLEQELKDFLDALRDTLDPETYARIVALAAGSRATEG